MTVDPSVLARLHKIESEVEETPRRGVRDRGAGGHVACLTAIEAQLGDVRGELRESSRALRNLVYEIVLSPVRGPVGLGGRFSRSGMARRLLEDRAREPQ